MGQLALDYNECERVKQFINNAINHADSEKSYLNDALNESFGCYASPEDEIRTAISDIETAVSKLQDFLKNFDTFINNVKEYDKNLANGFKNAECINKITNPTTSLEFGNILDIAQTTNSNISDGSGFAESAITIASIIKGGCYIQDLGNGKWRVVGSQEARAAAGLEVAGSTYRIGSQSFNNAGLNKYLPKGFTFEQYRECVGNNIKTGVKSIPGELSKLKDININSIINEEKILTKAKSIYTITKDDSKLGAAGKVLGYVGMGLDVGIKIDEDIENKASTGKIVADVGGVVVKDVVGMAVCAGCAEVGTEVGAAIGTALIPIPGAGTAIGAAVGFAAGYIGGKIYDKAADAIGDAIGSIGKAIFG